MPLAWDDSLSVGVAAFDEQHRRILAQLRLLGEAIGTGRLEATTVMARELVELVTAHFADEERWMREHAYPHLESHAAAHQAARETLRRAVAECEADGHSRRFQDLMERAARWLDIHLRAEDLRLGRFVQSLEPVAQARRALRQRIGEP